jgi:hypothetical protein
MPYGRRTDAGGAAGWWIAAAVIIVIAVVVAWGWDWGAGPQTAANNPNAATTAPVTRGVAANPPPATTGSATAAKPAPSTTGSAPQQ